MNHTREIADARFLAQIEQAGESSAKQVAAMPRDALIRIKDMNMQKQDEPSWMKRIDNIVGNLLALFINGAISGAGIIFGVFIVVKYVWGQP